MKWLRTIIVFDKGDVIKNPEWDSVHSSFVRSIESIDHPQGTGKLTLRKKIWLPEREVWLRNGVPYLRARFLNHIVETEKWKPEHGVGLAQDRKNPKLRLYPSLKEHQEEVTSEFGGFDFLTVTPSGLKMAIEWETGNISSSHRSMNKLAIALSTGVIQVGVLIVPSRACYENLTDRIGNIGELSGYLSLWESAGSHVEKGMLAISVVEHDEVTEDSNIPFLPAGPDGRSKKKKKKKKKNKEVKKQAKKAVPSKSIPNETEGTLRL